MGVPSISSVIAEYEHEVATCAAELAADGGAPPDYKCEGCERMKRDLAVLRAARPLLDALRRVKLGTDGEYVLSSEQRALLDALLASSGKGEGA